MTDAFYVTDGDDFVATAHTRGPWSPKHQHGGPPSALLARAIEAQAPGFVVARINYLRFKKGPADFDETVEKLTAATKKFKVERVQREDIQRMGGGAPESEGD